MITPVQGGVDARRLPLPDASVDLALWSPPYFAMRLYGGSETEMGRPQSVGDYVAEVAAAAAESIRCLRPGGSLFINVADRLVNRSRVRQTAHQPSLNAAAGRREWQETWAEAAAAGRVLTPGIAEVKEKSLALVPERLAVALADAGFIVRSHMIWSKTRGIPDPSAVGRFAIRHESVLQVAADGNTRGTFKAGSLPSVFDCPPSRGEHGHPAPWPEGLVTHLVTNFSRPGDVVLDAFAGSGVTGRVCYRLGREAVQFDLYEWSNA